MRERVYLRYARQFLAPEQIDLQDLPDLQAPVKAS